MTVDTTATAPTAMELTFILREAPTQSKIAGHLCAELRSTSPSIKILKILSSLGLWHPTEDCTINILEMWSSKQKHYKILRFTASPEVYRRLHELCSAGESNVPGHEDFAAVTERHLAALSVPVAITALVDEHDKATLKAMAATISDNYATVTGRNPSKKRLAEFICAHAA
jgi:hypothetical protein